MNINFVLIIILLLNEYLSLINATNSSSSLTMFILTTIQSSSSLIKHYLKRRSLVHMIYTTSNITNDSIKNHMNLSINKFRAFENSPIFNIIKDGSTLTKTQIKVIVTVVFIISFIIFILAIFRFKNACRDQETQNIQTQIIRQRVSQFSEPSSRRGSIGYYTRKYIRTPDSRFDEQLNTSSSTKRYSVPASNQSSKPATAVILSYTSRDSSATIKTSTPHQYVTSSYDTSNNTDNQHTSISIKPIVRKSCSAIGISRCDDQTPLLTSELASTIKGSSNRTTRKYSLNAFLPLVRSSNSHPFSSSSTTPTACGSNGAGDVNKNHNSVNIKSRRRVSLSSALRRNSFAKQSHSFVSTIDSTNTNKTSSSPDTSLPKSINNPSKTIDSDSSNRSSLLKTKTSNSKNLLKKKSSSITPIISSSSTTSSSSYRKDFMQKIERFRFIDDSASSTTTVTSPVESIDRINGHQPCSHLITSAIEQFDDYVRSRYHNNDEIDSYIDRFNSDILTNGSYSDLNMLNSTNDNITLQRPQTIQQHITFKPVNNLPSQFETDDGRQIIRNSVPISIPSQYSKHTYPSDNSLIRPTTIITNGHSRSMDFQSNKSELIRPTTLINNPGTIYETSTSSIATITSIRSSTSLEFDDDRKPSGVLVDDDFLPMSSPVDEHFWDMTTPTNHFKFLQNKNECFPNVGSSPDVEIKHFDIHQTNPLLSSSSIDQPFSETSCDEEEDDDDNNKSLNQQKYSIHEYKLKELQKPIVIHRSIFNPSIHSIELSHLDHDFNSIPIKNLSIDHSNDESLLEKFASANTESVQIPVRSPPLRTTIPGDIILSSQQYPQTIYEEDDTQESSTNDNISDESADNGEIDLVHEFELSKKQEEQIKPTNNNLWSTNDRDIFILQEDDLLSALVTTPTQQNIRPPPASIMKMTHNKSFDSIDESQATLTMNNTLKPKVRFNLDPQYEREREWNKVNKLLGNSVEWTDEFEV